MEFSLENRTARLSVGELADFQIGPRETGDGQQGLWRAQLGTHWHQQLRTQMGAENAAALFEIPLSGEVFHRGWRLTLNGRIDQLIPPALVSSESLRITPAARLREIKTVLRPLPAPEEELRAEYPSYFAQLATYLALARLQAPIHPSLGAQTPVHGELVFVEAGSGIVQSIPVTAAEEQLFTVQLERVVEFLDLQLQARERLRNLRFAPAFAQLRPGQETIQEDLRAALEQHPIVLLEAPTGFGKTGALLEAALGQMRAGRFSRLLYLTSKSTGQIQVIHQLTSMAQQVGVTPDSETLTMRIGTGLAIWHVRNRREHCVNTTFHCVRENCRYLHDLESRWKASDLSRFHLFENENRSIDALRAAGESALICPYEITRTALAFQDVWVGDYNYVFSPSSRGLFADQPGYDPAQTLLIVDEAHNLPSRVADAYSHAFRAEDAALVTEVLYRTRAMSGLLNVWEQWSHFLHSLPVCDSLDLNQEDDARHLLDLICKQLMSTALDYSEFGAEASEQLWRLPSFQQDLTLDLPRLWWSPRKGELSITCLDAAKPIGETLRQFGSAILASATLGPAETFVENCGLELDRETVATNRAESPGRFGKLNKRDTTKLFKNLSTGANLLEADRQRTSKEATFVRAATPWRDHAYHVAVDARVDTTFQNRGRFYGVTAETIEKLSTSAQRRFIPTGTASACVAVFFSSYQYAEAIVRALADRDSTLRVNLQPRLSDLNEQRAWIEESLVLSDAIFLVLGSSFAEGIDVLGGRIETAMVVGPALPEVNAIQRARIAALEGSSRDAAFQRIYRVPGLQKVNQALGRLVRAPGQHARVLLHCRRFADPAYAALLAPEYQFGQEIDNDFALAHWLDESAPSRRETPKSTDESRR
jgi:Rad3-related DNA helicase